MKYQEILDYLYSQLPMFHRIGAAAYKADLKNIESLCKKLGNPEKKLKFIHIAGTNGKGSVSNMLAAVFQMNGYKTGLFTSPHLIDFRERIRINGELISKSYIIRFVEKHKMLFEDIKPSFFEWTTALAFQYFYDNKVDIVVLETGMGGRLDSTNVVDPEMSIITNIGEDHKQFLGDTLNKIAFEKAGIIKPLRPVLISEYQKDVAFVFSKVAKEKRSPVIYAYRVVKIHEISPSMNFLELSYSLNHTNLKKFLDKSKIYFNINQKNNLDKYNKKIINNKKNYLDQSKNKLKTIQSALSGIYQIKNIRCVLAACEILKGLGWKLKSNKIHYAIKQTPKITRFRGRWETLQSHPLVIADIAHNKQGILNSLSNLKYYHYKNLRIIFGVVKDKEVESILQLLPKKVVYYITQASVPRALPVDELEILFKKHQLVYSKHYTTEDALKYALKSADKNDLILITGSAFIVSDALIAYDKMK